MATPGGVLGGPVFLIGTAFGHALGPVLAPAVQDLRNFAWAEHRVAPLTAETAAALWVEGTWTRDRADTEASYTGVSGGRLDALRDLIDNPPDLATMFQLWRRGLVDEAEFDLALRRLRIEPEWFGAIKATRPVLLTPDQLANARQRGKISADDQHREAALQGVTADRADVMFELSGLPPPTERAREMWRRGVITEAEFRTAVVEGNEKLKYVDEEVALFRPLLTPASIVNLALRGWRSREWMTERLAEHGYDADDSLDLFRGSGRPPSVRQVFIGQRRGGVYNGPTGDIDDHLLKAMQESNLRPEWFDIMDAQKESYPSAFVLRALAQAGDLDAAQTRRVLLEIGWPEWLVAAVVGVWTGSSDTDAGASARVKSAQTQAITEVRNAYVLGNADGAQARSWLDRIGVDAPDVDGLLPVWDVMREVPQTSLTAAQIKRAYRRLPDQWPRARALAELQQLGLTAGDAATLLDE